MYEVHMFDNRGFILRVVEFGNDFDSAEEFALLNIAPNGINEVYNTNTRNAVMIIGYEEEDKYLPSILYNGMVTPEFVHPLFTTLC